MSGQLKKLSSGSVQDALVNAAKKALDMSEPGLDYKYDPERRRHTLEAHGPHNILSDLSHAVTTLDNDPGNYKRKALANMGGAIAAGATAIGTMSYLARHMPQSLPTQGPSKLVGLACASFPLLAYYASRNIEDRPGRAALGGAAALGAGGIMIKDSIVPVPSRASFTKEQLVGAAGLATAGLAANYTAGMMSNLQLAANEEAIQGIMQDPGLTKAEKEHNIELIKRKKDFLSRYPLFRAAPYSEKLRGAYNSLHGVDFIKSKVR